MRKILFALLVLTASNWLSAKENLTIKNSGTNQVITWSENDYIVKEDLIISQNLDHNWSRDVNGPVPDEEPSDTNDVVVSSLTRKSTTLTTLWKKKILGSKGSIFSPAGYLSGKFDFFLIPNENRYWEAGQYYSLLKGDLLFRSTVAPESKIRNAGGGTSVPIFRLLGIEHRLYEVQDPSGPLVRIADIHLANGMALLDSVQFQGPMDSMKVPGKTIAESPINGTLSVHFETNDSAKPVGAVAEAIIEGLPTPYFAVIRYGGNGKEPEVVIRIPVLKDKFEVEKAVLPPSYFLKRLSKKEAGKSIFIKQP